MQSIAEEYQGMSKNVKKSLGIATAKMQSIAKQSQGLSRMAKE